MFYKLENKQSKNLLSHFLLAKFFLVIIFLIVFALPKTTLATAKLSGAAWWGEQWEYVYFDCNEYESGSRLDMTGNFYDLPEPRGFKFFIGGCVINHRVNIDSSGRFFGAAWNFKKGLINFGGTSTPVAVPNYNFNVNCNPGVTCDASNSCSACYNSRTQRIYGYAQASSTGDLIVLDSNLGLPTENNLQLKSWNLSSSTLPFYGSINPGDFVGHGSSVISGTRYPLSFNCLSENGGSISACIERDYKVYVSNPRIGQMTAPNWSYSDACNCSPNCGPGSAKKAVLRWNLASGSHDAYEIAVTKTNVLATSSPDTVCHSDFKLGNTLQYTIPNSGDRICKTSASLDYNTSYYWFIRLFYLEDGVYQATPWYQFGVNDDHEGAAYDINNGPPNLTNPTDNAKTFTTYKHEFPTPYFSWTPEEIVVNDENTIFTALDPVNTSKYFSPTNPNIALNCDEAGINCSYTWLASNDAQVTSPNNATTTIKFVRPGNSVVTLSITDPSGYYCARPILVTNINYGLPVWREIKAE